MRKIFAIAILLMTATMAWGQSPAPSFNDYLVDSTGRPVFTPQVRVCSPPPPGTGIGTPCSPPVTVYSDSALTQPKAPSFLGDGFGNYSFYAPAGNYAVQACNLAGTICSSKVITLPTGPGVATTWTAQQTFSQPIVSTVVTGTAPFTVASTTLVPNLNVANAANSAALNGNTFAAPGPIGSTTPSSGSFTTGIFSGALSANAGVSVPSGQVIGYSDAGFSRIGAGVLGLGNGTQGDTSGNLQLGLITKYNGLSTVSGGVPVIVATVNLTGQSVAVGPTTFFTPAVNGMYRATFATITTTVGNAQTITPSLLTTDGDNNSSLGSSGNAAFGNTLGSPLYTVGTFYLKGGSPIQYQTALGGALGTARYSLRIFLEWLGN